MFQLVPLWITKVRGRAITSLATKPQIERSFPLGVSRSSRMYSFEELHARTQRTAAPSTGTYRPSFGAGGDGLIVPQIL